MTDVKIGIVDRFLLSFFPAVAARRFASRSQANLLLRHYEATSPGRRTEGWFKSGSGVNSANLGNIAPLRNLGRDLYRNNGWSRRGVQAICNNTIGWGITPRTKSQAHAAAWKLWANSSECDRRGRLTFYAMEELAMRTMVISGESLIVRHRGGNRKNLALQISVLEPDYIDSTKNTTLKGGGWITQGVEFDSSGRRVAYYLHSTHPGEAHRSADVKRIPAEDVIHLFAEDRPEQVRGVSWLCAAILRLQDFDDYEDALLMRQKIAACYAVFVTDVDGAASPAGINEDTEDGFDSIEPGMIKRLKPGENVEFGTPPAVSDNDQFSRTSLRRIAASMGVSYEDLTGDYSQVNFSSARMGRLAHYGNVHSWRWNIVIPLMCARVWQWFEEALQAESGVAPAGDVEWTPPPMPMIDPDKEGKAFQMNVRSGLMTHSQMLAEQGFDSTSHWEEYKAGLDELDARGIILDSDARKTSAAGLSQDVNARKPASSAE